MGRADPVNELPYFSGARVSWRPLEPGPNCRWSVQNLTPRQLIKLFEAFYGPTMNAVEAAR